MQTNSIYSVRSTHATSMEQDLKQFYTVYNQFQSTEVKFQGQIISEKGISPDPVKIAAIQNVGEPKCVADICRFLGMTNQMSKFLPSLGDMTQPLRELLKINTQ